MGKREELCEAVLKEDVAAVRRLLRQGANVDWHNPTKGGGTVLHEAAWKGNVEIMHTLLQAGADMRARSESGYTPLHTAATWGHMDAVQALLQRGADVDKRDQAGHTPLHAAAWNGHVRILRALLDTGSDVTAADKYGRTPLHSAAYNGHAEAVRLLVQAGGAMAATSQGGSTPLHTAAYQGHVAAVQALLEAGADVAAKRPDGTTPLDPSFVGMGVKDTSERSAKVAAIQAAVQAAAAGRLPRAVLLPHTFSGGRRPQAVPASGSDPTPTPMAAASLPAPPSTSTEPNDHPTNQLAASHSAPAAVGTQSAGSGLYTGGPVTLPPPVTVQGRGVVQILIQGGFKAAVQVAAGVITCNPAALLAVPLQLLHDVQAAIDQDAFCRERIRRVAARIAAMEPALQQLGEELKPPMRTGTPPSVVQALCQSVLMLTQVLLALKDLEQRLRRQGAGLLRRALELLRAGGYREELDALEAELRDCLTQLSAVLNVAHFTQVAATLRAKQELQVASWQQQNEADRARDLQQLEGQVLAVAGGVQALQQQLAEQRLVLDGQEVGLQQVAEWLQRMYAGNGVIAQHLQQVESQVRDMHLDVLAMREHVAQLVEVMAPPRSGQQRQKRVPMDSLPDLALPRERIQVEADLDGALADAKRGAFGGVVQAVWEGHAVALKVYNYKGLAKGDCREAVREAVLLSKANHPNIVRCYGVVYDPDTAAMDSIQGSLVMEWVGGGTLNDWLQDEEELGLRGRLLLALRLAAGMRQLHEKKLVHGDLKPQNILMCSEQAAAADVVPQVKICDFNLSKYTSSSLQPSRHLTKAYTLAYASPERTRTFVPSHGDDVYAFGILLSFIATGRTPFSDIRPEHLREAIQATNPIVRPDLGHWLGQQGPGEPQRQVAECYCQLAKQCWSAEAAERPTFEEVHSQLSDMLQHLGA